MPNSSIIDDMKTRVQDAILADPLLVKAIDAKDVTEDNVADLIGTHIFTFAQNPNLVQSSETFLTIQVHIPQYNSPDYRWVHPVLEIWIISHNRHMRVDNIPRIRANRNDFISQLLDEKFNGSTDFGYGQMFLQLNTEGVHGDNSDFLYRRMVFVTKDLSRSTCR